MPGSPDQLSEQTEIELEVDAETAPAETIALVTEPEPPPAPSHLWFERRDSYSRIAVYSSLAAMLAVVVLVSMVLQILKPSHLYFSIAASAVIAAGAWYAGRYFKKRAGLYSTAINAYGAREKLDELFGMTRATASDTDHAGEGVCIETRNLHRANTRLSDEQFVFVAAGAIWTIVGLIGIYDWVTRHKLPSTSTCTGILWFGLGVSYWLKFTQLRNTISGGRAVSAEVLLCSEGGIGAGTCDIDGYRFTLDKSHKELLELLTLYHPTKYTASIYHDRKTDLPVAVGIGERVFTFSKEKAPYKSPIGGTWTSALYADAPKADDVRQT